VLELFNLGNRDQGELLADINRQVNEAIELALRKQMYSATVNIKIDMTLSSVNDANGRAVLAPEFDYRIKTKLGGTYDGPKGKSQTSVGLQLEADGIYREKFLDQQMTMEGVS